MKVKELIELLNKYSPEMEIDVLQKLKPCGAGKLLKIVEIDEFIDLDNNKTKLRIETEEYYKEKKEEITIGGFEREEEYK